VRRILTRTKGVKVLATSREGLRVDGNHLWPVPSLGLAEGADSSALELFVERARAVAPGFSLDDPDDLAAAEEICRRLDGIALAIELAAARMISMTPEDVRDRLDDRFRLLSGGQPGLERHQTLRHAVRWSYDLLDHDERAVLNHAAVFAGGFDLSSLAAVCDSFDEYVLLDVVDSLVRKSLINLDRSGGHARYGLLETIRQFAEEQLADGGTISQARDRHARYFAGQAASYYEIWMGPRQRVVLDWVDVELANLRAGFRWAADSGELDTAVAIAAHGALLAYLMPRFEPAGWAEEILAAAATAEVAQLPRLYTAAGLCMFSGHYDVALGYFQRAVALEADPRYDPFEDGWSTLFLAGAYLFAGQVDRCLDIYSGLAAQPGWAHLQGLWGLLMMLPAVGRAEEAMAIAEETLTATRAGGNPGNIALALAGYGRAFSESDPARALTAFRDGLAHTREHRVLLLEALLVQDAAGLEALHGDSQDALAMFDTAVDSAQRAGNIAALPHVFAGMAMMFDRLDRPETAATIYGAVAKHGTIHLVQRQATLAV